MDNAKNANRGIYFLLVVVVLAWGLSWPVNKEGLAFVPPLWFASLRLFFATLAMFISVIFLKKFIIPTRKDLPLIFVLGIFQIGLFILLINVGLHIQPAGLSAMLVYTTPLWVMPIAIFFFKEGSSFLKWLGFVLGLIGVFILLEPWSINWSDSKILLGNAALVGASFSFAISILCARYMTWHRAPIELISWQLLVGTILIFSVALIVQPKPVIEWNLTSTLCIAYTALVATAFGFLGMSKLSKELPSSLTSLAFLGVPVSGVIFSVIFLGEQLKLFMVIAILFIIAGLLSVVLGDADFKS